MTSEQAGAADEVARRLNEAFFSVSPGDHFRARAAMLLELGDRAAGAGAPTEPGPFTDDIRSRLPGWSSEPQADRVREQTALTIEAFMLAHHAGESLLRQFLAQISAGPKAPPWLVMSARSEKFRQRLLVLRDMPSEDLARLAAWAFLGDREQLEALAGKDAVDAHVAHAAGWLVHCASWHVETSNGYNAAKHGLSSLPDQARVSLFIETGEAGEGGADAASAAPATEVLMLAGAVLETLEHEGRGTSQRWYRVMRSIDAAGLVASAFVIAGLLDDLWRVGRARHLGTAAEIALTSGPSLHDMILGHELEWGSFRVPIYALPLDPEAAEETLAKLLGNGDQGSDTNATSGL